MSIMQLVFYINEARHRGKIRKYVPNSKHVKHTGMLQHFHRRILYAKTAVCSRVPEFAAYFRQAIPKVRGNPRAADHAPILSSGDLRFCCRKMDCARRFLIFPALPETR